MLFCILLIYIDDFSINDMLYVSVLNKGNDVIMEGEIVWKGKNPVAGKITIG